MTDDCPLTEDTLFQPPAVNVCPGCGGDVEQLEDAPTMYRCLQSGETFSVE